MTAYEESVRLGLTGSDAEVVAQLIATGITVKPIELAYLLELLNFRGMLRKTDGNSGDERWKGTLQNLKAALVSLNQMQAVEGFEMWFSHVTNPRQSRWDTTKPEFAAPFWAMYQAFADQPGMPSVADFLAVVALGDGWLFAELTAEQFAADRAVVLLASEKLQMASDAADRLQAYNEAVSSWDGSEEARPEL